MPELGNRLPKTVQTVMDEYEIEVKARNPRIYSLGMSVICNRYYHIYGNFSITSWPPIYGLRTLGTLTALSSIKLFSMIDIRALVFATSVEFNVWSR